MVTSARIPRLVDNPDPDNVYLLDTAALPMLRRMMKVGVLIDREKLLTLERRILREMRELESRIYDLAGRRFNIASDDQVAALLFDSKAAGGLGIDSRYVKKTKKTRRPSCKKDELEKVADRHPIIRLIIDWQHRRHLRSCFVEKLPRHIDPETGRIHTNFKHTRAETGRFAAENPPLQQIPVRTELGKMIRYAFVAAEGRKLVEADYSQIEMRVAAHVSKDPVMTQIFRDGEDIHWRTAEAALLRPLDRNSEADKEERASYKNVGFGVLYGLQGIGLRNQMLSKGASPEHWTLERCAGYITKWFEIYNGILIWMKEQWRTADIRGFVWDMFGRVRYTPQVRSVLPWIAAEGYRIAGNSPIQSGAMGISKLAMSRWAVMGYIEELWERGIWCEPLLQTHDSILLEVDEDYAEEVGANVKEIMEAVTTLRVPVVADYSVGDSWGELK